ncbi:MAG: GDCCVxC domain-containing (seleno)protein [Myxococcota bacterium]
MEPAGTPVRSATLTCPECGHRKRESMPVDACQFFYDCEGCGSRLKPKRGDCCVFCSYADVRCPPVQAEAIRGERPRPQ